jgi:hypothetical protein
MFKLILGSYGTIGLVTTSLRIHYNSQWTSRLSPREVSPLNLQIIVGSLSLWEGLTWPQTLYEYSTIPEKRISDPTQWPEDKRVRMRNYLVEANEVIESIREP